MNKKSTINQLETDKKLISILKRLPNNYWDFKYDNTKEYTHGIDSYPAVMVSPISRNIINIVIFISKVKTNKLNINKLTYLLHTDFYTHVK